MNTFLTKTLSLSTIPPAYFGQLTQYFGRPFGETAKPARLVFIVGSAWIDNHTFPKFLIGLSETEDVHVVAFDPQHHNFEHVPDIYTLIDRQDTILVLRNKEQSIQVIKIKDTLDTNGLLLPFFKEKLENQDQQGIFLDTRYYEIDDLTRFFKNQGCFIFYTKLSDPDTMRIQILPNEALPQKNYTEKPWLQASERRSGFQSKKVTPTLSITCTVLPHSLEGQTQRIRRL